MPNKARSVAQFKYLQALAHGRAKSASLTPEKAREMLGDQRPKGLPKKAKKR